MKLTLKDLVINSENYVSEDVLHEWRWLIGDSVRIILVSALGDLFLELSDGDIQWLDVGTGQLLSIAGDAQEFQQLVQQKENMDEWLIPQLVGDLIQAGKLLKLGECYSFKVPPILGGEIEVKNYEPCDISVHFNLLGQIQRKAKDLPPGTNVNQVDIED